MINLEGGFACQDLDSSVEIDVPSTIEINGNSKLKVFTKQIPLPDGSGTSQFVHDFEWEKLEFHTEDGGILTVVNSDKI